jgi:hypothetical protein
MKTLAVGDFKAHFSEVLKEVESGEEGHYHLWTEQEKCRCPHSYF